MRAREHNFPPLVVFGTPASLPDGRTQISLYHLGVVLLWQTGWPPGSAGSSSPTQTHLKASLSPEVTLTFLASLLSFLPFVVQQRWPLSIETLWRGCCAGPGPWCTAPGLLQEITRFRHLRVVKLSCAPPLAPVSGIAILQGDLQHLQVSTTFHVACEHRPSLYRMVLLKLMSRPRLCRLCAFYKSCRFVFTPASAARTHFSPASQLCGQQ